MIKVILADDHQMILDGLKRFVDEEPDMEVVGMAGNGLMLIELESALRPDLAVVDVSLPDMNGIDATRRLLKDHPELKIIALSMHGDMKNLVGMLRAGAKGYISKESASQELVRGIRWVMAGYNYLCPILTTAMVDVFLGGLHSQEYVPAPDLTPREREVLALLAQGAVVKEIAYQLGLNPKTVDTHRHNIMKKLGIDNLAELVKYALREGLAAL